MSNELLTGILLGIVICQAIKLFKHLLDYLNYGDRKDSSTENNIVNIKNVDGRLHLTPSDANVDELIQVLRETADKLECNSYK